MKKKKKVLYKMVAQPYTYQTLSSLFDFRFYSKETRQESGRRHSLSFKDRRL